MSINYSGLITRDGVEHSPEIVFGHITNAMRYVCQLYRHSVCRSEFEDLCHEVFVLLLEDNCHRLGTFDARKSSLKTWIYAVTRHYVKRQLQQKCRAVNFEDIAQASLIYYPKQESTLLHQERWKAIHLALARMSEYSKKILPLTIEGFSDAEISRLTGIKVDAVRKHRYALIGKLRRLLEEEGSA